MAVFITAAISRCFLADKTTLFSENKASLFNVSSHDK